MEWTCEGLRVSPLLGASRVRPIRCAPRITRAESQRCLQDGRGVAPQVGERRSPQAALITPASLTYAKGPAPNSGAGSAGACPYPTPAPGSCSPRCQSRSPGAADRAAAQPRLRPGHASSRPRLLGLQRPWRRARGRGAGSGPRWRVTLEGGAEPKSAGAEPRSVGTGPEPPRVEKSGERGAQSLRRGRWSLRARGGARARGGGAGAQERGGGVRATGGRTRASGGRGGERTGLCGGRGVRGGAKA